MLNLITRLERSPGFTTWTLMQSAWGQLKGWYGWGQLKGVTGNGLSGLREIITRMLLTDPVFSSLLIFALGKSLLVSLWWECETVSVSVKHSKIYVHTPVFTGHPLPISSEGWGRGQFCQNVFVTTWISILFWDHEISICYIDSYRPNSVSTETKFK
jgi:hypothetical protein